MKKFEYVTKKEYQPVKNELIELIKLVQDEVREYFTFRFDFIGSSSRNMITREVNGNIGYDFDVNIRVNDDNEDYSAEEIKNILIKGFNAHNRKFNYDYCEDSKRVITIKVKDKINSKILHSCDFAVVNDYFDNFGNECQEYIHHYKQSNAYQWQDQPNGYYLIQEKIKWIKQKRLWQYVRDLYLEKKCTNNNPNKKSRSIFAETISEIFNNNDGEF